MKNKLTATIRVSGIDKTKFVERSYKDKEGNQVSVKEFKLDLVPLKERKAIVSGEGWVMFKVGFVTMSPTKEEKQAKTKLPIIGDVIEFESTQTSKVETVDADSIPF
jgi:hypothetical protein